MEFTIVDGSTYTIVRSNGFRELFLVPPTLHKKAKEIVAPTVPTYIRSAVPVVPIRESLRDKLRKQREDNRMQNIAISVGIFAISFISGAISALF